MRSLVSRRQLLALAGAGFAGAQPHSADGATTVPVRRPGDLTEPSGAVFAQRLPPPSEPFPPSAVQGPVTRFTPASFTLGAFRSALVAGGTIELAAGTYDLTRWSLVPLANVRLVGAGKDRTTLRTAARYGGDWADRSTTGNFGLLRGRVEVEGLSFVNLKNVFVLHVRGGAEISHTPDLGPMCERANALGNTPSDFSAGVAIRDCGFRDCRRPVYGSEKGGERPRNFWMYGCDIQRCWVGGMSIATGRVSHIYMYDCYVADTVLERDTSAKSSASQNAITMEWGINSTGGHASWTAVNMRIESCTFDGSAYLGPVRLIERNGRLRPAWPRGSVIRLMGVGTGCWIKNTRFRRTGRLSDGRLTTAAHNSYPIYYKGHPLLISNCVFEENCGTCIVSVKGDDPDPNRYPSGPILQNVLFSDNLKNLVQPVFFDQRGIYEGADPTDLRMIGVLGQNRLGSTQISNVTFRNIETRKGLLFTYKSPGRGGATGQWSIENVTFENFRALEETCLLRFSHDLTGLAVRNVRAEGVAMAGTRQALICMQDAASLAQAEIQDVRVELVTMADRTDVEFALLRGMTPRPAMPELPSGEVAGASRALAAAMANGREVPLTAQSRMIGGGAETASWIGASGCAVRS